MAQLASMKPGAKKKLQSYTRLDKSSLLAPAITVISIRRLNTQRPVYSVVVKHFVAVTSGNERYTVLTNDGRLVHGSSCAHSRDGALKFCLCHLEEGLRCGSFEGQIS